MYIGIINIYKALCYIPVYNTFSTIRQFLVPCDKRASQQHIAFHYTSTNGMPNYEKNTPLFVFKIGNAL